MIDCSFCCLLGEPAGQVTIDDRNEMGLRHHRSSPSPVLSPFSKVSVVERLMSEFPETQETLLLKVKNPADAEAWERFSLIYRPAVYRFARRRGMQDADAEDLSQQVMMSIARAIPDWVKDESRGTFRTWLARVARNAVINAVTRVKPDRPLGGSAGGLGNMPAPTDELQQLIEEEHRRALFRWAAEEVRPEFQSATWDAFHMSTIDELPITEVAKKLNVSTGSVYAARSRIMRRLKTRLTELEADA